MALDQCRDFLASLRAQSRSPPRRPPTAAARWREHGDPAEAAIAAPRAAALYGLRILRDGIGDHPEAFTRFVSMRPYTRLDRERADCAHGVLVRDRAPARGALPARSAASRRGIDLVRLVSRPLPESPLRYRFDAVVAAAIRSTTEVGRAESRAASRGCSCALPATDAARRRLVTFGRATVPVDATLDGALLRWSDGSARSTDDVSSDP